MTGKRYSRLILAACLAVAWPACAQSVKALEPKELSQVDPNYNRKLRAAQQELSAEQEQRRKLEQEAAKDKKRVKELEDALRRAHEARVVAPPVPQPVTPTAQPLASKSRVFKDCADCPEMVVIPARRFTMGSPEGEAGRDKDEGPQHEVSVKRFALGKTEVTFAQWDACVVGGGCSHRPEDQGWGRGNRPVINVNWNDAQEYLKWLSAKTGKTYRLPSEAEWEYAARAGSTIARPWGNNLGDACRYANVYDATGKRVNGYPWEAHNCDDGEAKTAPVGKYAANAFGLHDMIGNVWEWVEDCWHDSYQSAPIDGSAWTSGTCNVRVVRGGSWSNGPDGARIAYRGKNDTTERNGGTGFRLARMPRSFDRSHAPAK